MAGISTYQANPPRVGIYSNKTQRPRSEEQRSKPKESIETPTPLPTDPDSENDPKTKDADSTTPPHTSHRSCPGEAIASNSDTRSNPAKHTE